MVLVTLRSDTSERALHTQSLTAAQRAVWEAAGLTVGVLTDYGATYGCDVIDCAYCGGPVVCWESVAEHSLMGA